MTHWENACTSVETLPNGEHIHTIGIRPRAWDRPTAGGGTSLTANDRGLFDTGAALLPLRASGPIQVGIAGNMAPGTPIVGLRRRGRGLALVPIGVNTRPGQNVLDGDGNLIGRRWLGLWTGVDAQFAWGGHLLSKDFDLLQGHPSTFDFKILRAGDWNGNLPRVTARGFDVDDDGGKPLFFARKPYLYKPGDLTAASVPVNLILRQVNGDWYLRLTLPAPVAPATDWRGWTLEPTWESQPDATAGKDTYMFAGRAEANYGVAPALQIGFNALLSSALLQFDLSAAPANPQSVTLTVYDLDDAAKVQDWTCNAHRCLVVWVEGTKNDATETGSPCWSWRVFATSPWNTDGCRGSGVDHAAAVAGSADFPAAGADFRSFTIDLAEYALLRASNNGLLLRSSNEALNGGYGTIASSDGLTASQRPKLTVVTVDQASNFAGRGRVPILSRGRW